MATTVKSDQTRPGMPLLAERLLIDQFMPTYDLAVVRSRVFRVLVGACGLPQRLAEALRRRADQAAAPSPPTFRLRDMPAMGWMLLGEWPGAEPTFGQVAKPWKPRGGSPAAPVSRASSLPSSSRDLPSWWRARGLTPMASGRRSRPCRHRVRCTDPDSRRRLRRYWLLVGPCSHLLRRTALRVYAKKLEGPGCAC